LKNPISSAPTIKSAEITITDDKTLEVTPRENHTLETVFSEFSSNNIQILSMRNKSNRLEELFMNLVRK